MDLFTCASCGTATKPVVIETGPMVIGATRTIKRRRKCPACNNRFTTVEVPAEWAEDLFMEDAE